MRSLTIFLVLLCACGQATTPMAATTPLPDAEPSAAPVTTLLIELATSDEPRKASRDSLLKVEPNITTLPDLYALVGHPRARKDMADEIALLYASELGKLPHIVLVNGRDSSIQLVSIYNHNNDYFSLDKLREQYGQPILAATISSRDHLFFPGKGIAAIVESSDNTNVWYVQLLPKAMTLENYQEHDGYWQETFAFTP